MDRVEDCISFLIGKAAQQIARRSREKLASHGVTPTQYAVMKVLWENEPQSGSEMGSRLQMDSATITGVIDRLEAADLVERRPDPSDRRIHRLFLTRRGRSLQKPLDRAMDELNAEAREVLGKQASAVLKGLRQLGGGALTT
ncbi:MarR family winged helix-turn-helix transcriptional regulator [Pelagibius sp. Alg239-R121]|uniref:MarR family winged helix-turn-helix transcriptional regulator n=1 Tax=Pelagibius sp. Alg239-R121 TaxID=2993448 RepID=UPI0024A6FECE|nr:MarR family transcriptional regulator [Pelagibius sp. Alg239-R121]